MSAPLARLHILLTRPDGQAGPLRARLEELGARVSVFPALRIEPLAPDAAALRFLADADWAIFASANAVRHLYAGASAPPALPARLAAIGPATAQALQDAGAADALVAASPHTSEALLAAPPLAALRGRRVAVVRGRGGRTLISDTLARRGNAVRSLEVYRRAPTERTLAFSALGHGAPDRICIASAQTAERLLACIRAQDRTQLLDCPVVAGGARVAARCRALGFRAVAAAATPTDDAMLEALTA